MRTPPLCGVKQPATPSQGVGRTPWAPWHLLAGRNLRCAAVGKPAAFGLRHDEGESRPLRKQSLTDERGRQLGNSLAILRNHWSLRLLEPSTRDVDPARLHQRMPAPSVKKGRVGSAAKEGCRAMDNNSNSQVSVQPMPGLLTALSETEKQFLSGSRDRGRDLGSCRAHFPRISPRLRILQQSMLSAVRHRLRLCQVCPGASLLRDGTPAGKATRAGRVWRYDRWRTGDHGSGEPGSQGGRGPDAWAARTSPCPRSSRPIRIWTVSSR